MQAASGSHPGGDSAAGDSQAAEGEDQSGRAAEDDGQRQGREAAGLEEVRGGISGPHRGPQKQHCN